VGGGKRSGGLGSMASGARMLEWTLSMVETRSK
jgi:hypothetical protein